LIPFLEYGLHPLLGYFGANLRGWCADFMPSPYEQRQSIDRISGSKNQTGDFNGIYIPQH
jgi:hypothetical protein